MVVIFGCIEMFFMFIIWDTIFGEILIKRICMYIVISLCTSIINSVAIRYIGISKPILVMIFLIIVSIVLSKVCKRNLINILPEVLVTYLIVMFIEIIFSLLMVILFRDVKDDWKISLSYIISAFLISTLGIKNLVKKLKLKGVKKLVEYRNINITLFNLFMVFMFLLMINKLIQVSIKNLVEISILCSTIIIVNIYYLISINKKKDLNKKVEIDNNINPLIDELLQDMKAKEHEYNNHMTVMYSMIQVCNPDELKSKAKIYLGEMKEKNQYLTEVAYIKNTIVQAIIYNKLKEAERYDTTLNHEIVSDLVNIKIDNSELTVILSNLINNAIEATKNQLNREIDVYIGNLGEKHIIKVSNWIDDEKRIDTKKFFKAGFSTKDSKRGYGLHNVKLIVDKYKGKVDVEVKENKILFIIEV